MAKRKPKPIFLKLFDYAFSFVIIFCFLLLFSFLLYALKGIWDEHKMADFRGQYIHPVALKGNFSNETSIIHAEKLYADNKDYLGWVTIEETPINYPVMSGDKYYRKNFQKKFDEGGLPFIKEYSPKRNPINIFGHNMGYGRKDYFSCLLNFKDEEYFKAHPYVYLTMRSEKGNRYKIIGYMEYKIKDIPNWNYNVVKFGSDKDFLKWKNEVSKRLIQKDAALNEISIDKGRILILTTCHSKTWREDGIRSVLICYRSEKDSGTNIKYENDQ